MIYYTKEDFLIEGQSYDVIMDCVGHAPFERAAPCVNPGGALLPIISDLNGMLIAPRQTSRSAKLVTAGIPISGLAIQPALP